MSREPILSAEDAAPANNPSPGNPSSELAAVNLLTREEETMLRPRKLEEMVGQRKVYERLMIAVEAASIRKEPLGHILLDGLFALVIIVSLATMWVSPAELLPADEPTAARRHAPRVSSQNLDVALLIDRKALIYRSLDEGLGLVLAVQPDGPALGHVDGDVACLDDGILIFLRAA